MENINEINSEAKTRIFAAADKLYQACGRETFPTVDAVRKEAKAAMGDVSAVMREWRRSQTAQAVTPEIQAPDAILQSAKVLVSEVWKQAHDLATESLKSAQAAWDAERAEAELLRAELGQAFDDQAKELETVKSDLETANHLVEKLKVDLEESCAHLEDATKDLSSAQAKINDQSGHIATLEAQIKDMQRQADEAAKKLDAVNAAKTDAEKQVAVLETQLFAEKEKIIALEKAHKAESEKTNIALQAFKDDQFVDRKALSDANARIAVLEDQAIRDRAQIDALHIEVVRLNVLATQSREIPSEVSGGEWA